MNLKYAAQIVFVSASVLAVITLGCSETNGNGPGSCAAYCDNQPACGRPSAQPCIDRCASQMSQCNASSHSADFQVFLDCASKLTSSAYTCGSSGPETSQCADEALKLLECGESATDGGAGDAGEPDGAPAADTGGADRFIPFYDGSMDAVTPCYTNQPFTASPWAPPTSLHQGLCTADQIATFINTMNSSGSLTSGSAACDACLETDVGAAAHGPIVTAASVPVQTNWGGCIASLDGATADGSCGQSFDDATDCIAAACGSCSDFPSGGPNTDVCRALATGADGRCAAHTTTSDCAAEMQAGGVAAACGPALSNLLTIWCGP